MPIGLVRMWVVSYANGILQQLQLKVPIQQTEQLAKTVPPLPVCTLHKLFQPTPFRQGMKAYRQTQHLFVSIRIPSMLTTHCEVQSLTTATAIYRHQKWDWPASVLRYPFCHNCPQMSRISTVPTQLRTTVVTYPMYERATVMKVRNCRIWSVFSNST